MKTQHFVNARIMRALSSTLILPFQMLPVSEGETQPQDIEVADIARLCVRVNGVGETGIGREIGTTGATRYEIDGSELLIHLAAVEQPGDMFVTVDGSYGQVRLHAVVSITVADDGATEVELKPYVFAAISGGGGADYKTDMYMDGSGRVIVERTEDGGTLVLDEHENPILKRNADGTTEVYDAYQSGRVAVSANGGVTINSGDGEHFIVIGSAVVGATTDTEVGTNALVNGYGCKATGTNSHAEGAATVASGVSSHAEGSSDGTIISTASGEASHVEGMGCRATGQCAHAEGWHCSATADWAHAEGQQCAAGGSRSHAEGSLCSTTDAYSHAEGFSSKASGTAAHSEGISCIASGSYSHAEGSYCRTAAYNSHAQGIFNNHTDANVSGSFSHGCGTSDADRRNAFLIVGSEVYVYGVGGYDGTNHAAEGVQSLRQVLSAINLKLVNVPQS